ncbi:hypothetical protein Q7P37_002016 [Cladosporium fusiforme]
MPPTSKPPSGVQTAPITTEDTYRLRHEVLWPHKPLSSVQVSTDSTSIHLGAFTNEKSSLLAENSLIGVITIALSQRANTSIQGEPPSNGVEAQFRKLAVAPEWQGRGVGSKLLEQAAVVAGDAGADSLWCDARTSALPFYEKFGMHSEGSTFMRKDVEYVKMRRMLS